MQCTVIVRPESPIRFVARAAGLSELESIAPSETEAVEQVKQKLTAWQNAKVVEVNVPTGNPWLDTFGRSATDPQFDDYVAEVKRYRDHEAE